MHIAQTAAEAFERYNALYADGRLIQGSWHSEKDGRQLACALGALGAEIDGPSKCPAQIMPRWLAQMVPWFFDNQSFNDATAWGLAFYAELKRIDGKVPYSVAHDWQANVVCLLAIEVAEKRKRPVEPHQAVQALHVRAIGGDVAKKQEWLETLRPACADAYADADAYSYAYADADAYSYAYAPACAHAYADTHAHAYADTHAHAYADAKKKAVKRLADGMVECLLRVPSEVV